MSFALTHLAGFGVGGDGYRYFRWTVTTLVGTAGFFTNLANAQVSANGGSSWLPGTMSANSTPAPLVASARTEGGIPGNDAWQAFDNNLSTLWSSTSLATSGTFSPAEWLQIDLGAGNGVTPNKMRLAYFNTGGNDCTWKDFILEGSNTGSFAGEQILLKTVAAQASQAHLTNIEYNIP